MKLKGAIFDLDGTLLDSMPFWENLGSEYLKRKGYNPPENINEILKTMSLYQSARYFRHEFAIAENDDEIIKEILELIEIHYRTTVAFKESVIPFLESFHEGNIRMCIATATDFSLAKAALERLNADKYFEFILTCSEAGIGKDDPGFFQITLNKLKTSAHDTIVFEDALYAIKSAKESGLYVVAVYDKSADMDQQDIKAIADLYLTTYKDLNLDDIRKFFEGTGARNP